MSMPTYRYIIVYVLEVKDTAVPASREVWAVNQTAARQAILDENKGLTINILTVERIY